MENLRGGGLIFKSVERGKRLQSVWSGGGKRRNKSEMKSFYPAGGIGATEGLVGVWAN
jgi:hypothetical protein